MQPRFLLSPQSAFLLQCSTQEQQFQQGEHCLKQTLWSFANVSPLPSALRWNVPSVTWMPVLLLLHLMQDVTGSLAVARFCVCWAAMLWAWCLISSCLSESSQEVCLNVSSSDDRGRCAPAPNSKSGLLPGCAAPQMSCVSPWEFPTLLYIKKKPKPNQNHQKTKPKTNKQKTSTKKKKTPNPKPTTTHSKKHFQLLP